MRVESERTQHAGDGWKRQAKKNDRRRLKADKQINRKKLQSMRPLPTTSSRLCKQYHPRTKQHTCWRLLLCDAQRGFRSFIHSEPLSQMHQVSIVKRSPVAISLPLRSSLTLTFPESAMITLSSCTETRAAPANDLSHPIDRSAKKKRSPQAAKRR